MWGILQDSHHQILQTRPCHKFVMEKRKWEGTILDSETFKRHDNQMQCVKKPVSTHTIALLADIIFSVSPQMQMSMKTKPGEKEHFY